jgi:hypothetical protein
MLHPRAVLCRVNRSPLPYHNQHPIICSSTNKLLTLAFISLGAYRMASSSSSSSSNFQLIINNALDAYKKRTKNDLLAHPLASKLQTCNTPSAILTVLQQQIQGLDQSRSSDDRWTRWLDPTVNILFALSATLGEGVGLVCQTMSHNMNSSDICILIFIRQVFSPAKVVFAGVGVLLSVRILLNKILWAIVTPPSPRQLRMLEQAKIL